MATEDNEQWRKTFPEAELESTMGNSMYLVFSSIYLINICKIFIKIIYSFFIMGYIVGR